MRTQKSPLARYMHWVGGRAVSSHPGFEPADAASRDGVRDVSRDGVRDVSRDGVRDSSIGRPPEPNTGHARPRSRRHLTWSDMRRIVAGALQDCLTDRVSLAAAGSAFYGTLALFPAISVLVSAYGLVFDPASVEPQLHLLAGLLPAPAFMLIEDRVHELLQQPPASLSVGLIVSSLLVFWSAATGSKALLSAVNVAYDVPEQRSFMHFQTLGLVMTLAAVISAVLTLGVLLVMRPLLAAFGLTAHGIGLIRFASQVMVILTFAASIALLYRYGPSRPPPPRPRLWIGTLSATMLWLAASEALSLYISNIGSFGATYGSIGAVVGVMLWLYVSAYAVLLGAELNASLEAFEAGN